MWLLVIGLILAPGFGVNYLFGNALLANAAGLDPIDRAFAISFGIVPMGYALLVILVTSGGFRSQRSRAIRRPIAAFALAVVIITSLYVFLPGTESAIEALNNALGTFGVVAFAVGLLAGAAGYLYVFIRAAVDLVEAERGAATRLGLKVGTAILLLYWLVSIPFIQMRLRRLLREDEGGKMWDFPMERLTLQPQASGHLSLLLTERAGWDDFEAYAAELLHRLDGTLIKKVSGPDGHIWDVEIETTPLQLVFDDFPLGVTLESRSYPGDIFLRKLQSRLARSA